MKLLIHIGTHKTGTTSFQRLCRDQKYLLAQNKVIYPSYKDWLNHSGAAYMLQRRNISEFRNFLISIYEEAIKLQGETTLLSGECFENFLVDNQLAILFQKIAFQVGFKEIEWVVVHRNAFDYLLSIYSEMSKHDCIINIEQFAKTSLQYGFASVGTPIYNHKFVFDIKKFSKIFKADVNENLSIIPYPKFIDKFIGKEIFTDYLPQAELYKLESYNSTQKKLNRRLDPRWVELRYLENFLGYKINEEFLKSNKNFITSFIVTRLKRKRLIERDIKKKFGFRFVES